MNVPLGELFEPRAAAKGAVIILHERYGLVKHTLDLAQRLAADGYVALAPNLFSKFENQQALQRGEARVVLPDDEVAGVIDRAIEFVKQRAEHVALMGVCQSGRYPIVVGSRRSDLAACVVFYGASQQRDWDKSDLQPRSMGHMLRELRAPALFVYGERDHTISLENVRRVRDALEAARRSYRMKVFAEMPHGFLNDTMPGRYRPKEAAQAWQMLLAFLAEVFAGEWRGRVRWEFEGASAMDYDFSKNKRLE